MSVLVVSDIHSNLEALDAVLADVGPFDSIWSLGDIVGYGPNPNECIARIREFKHLAIPGNHDLGVLGQLDLEDFNPEARQANLWNREQLSQTSRGYLEALSETHVEGQCTLAHGSPRHPIWEYIIHLPTAKANFAFFESASCLVGHTHLPVVFRLLPSGECQATVPPERPVRLSREERYIINPGSVGQPRDGDPRAAYMFLDTEEWTIEHRRVSYNVEQVQRKMRAAGLPPRLANRLQHGW
jgi:predicted phosphodiesterase